jgi:transcription initiation factor IIE alpha subunit
MLEIGRRGIGFRNVYNKERLKNAKWFVHVCKPELQRLAESIAKLKRKCQKIVRRIKDFSAEMEELEDYYYCEVIHFKTTFGYSKHF